MPDEKLANAPPIDNVATAQANSFSVMTNAWLELKIDGPAGADHPSEIP